MTAESSSDVLSSYTTSDVPGRYMTSTFAVQLPVPPSYVSPSCALSMPMQTASFVAEVIIDAIKQSGHAKEIYQACPVSMTLLLYLDTLHPHVAAPSRSRWPCP